MKMQIFLVIALCFLCKNIKSESGSQLVVGSGFAAEKEFPHTALIGYERSKNDADLICGGSLITKRYVLSKAHCLYSGDLGRASYVKLGNVIRGEVNTNTFRYEIEERIRHPNNTVKSIDDDIALIKLQRDVEFNDYVQPACLPKTNDETELAIFSGWGRIMFEDPSNKLKKIVMEIFTQKECRELFAVQRPLTKEIDYETKICAGSHALSGIDACDGDAGSPLQIASTNDTCKWTIIGIASYGFSYCGQAGVPGIYTRVWPYKDWIEALVN